MNNRKPTFSVTCAADTAEIYIYDAIGQDWFGGISATMVKDELAKIKNVKEITIHLNSPGGDVFEGNAIYNLLNAHKATKYVEIDGLAASMGSVIAMVGDEIRMAENAMMMIHDPRGGMFGTSAELRKQADLIDAVKDSLVGTYVARTGKTEKVVAALMADETWMSAKEAVEMGFATSVTEPKRVAACANLDKFGFRNVPAQLLAKMQSPHDDQVKAELAALRAKIAAAKNN